MQIHAPQSQFDSLVLLHVDLLLTIMPFVNDISERFEMSTLAIAVLVTALFSNCILTSKAQIG